MNWAEYEELISKYEAAMLSGMLSCKFSIVKNAMNAAPTMTKLSRDKDLYKIIIIILVYSSCEKNFRDSKF